MAALRMSLVTLPVRVATGSLVAVLAVLSAAAAHSQEPALHTLIDQQLALPAGIAPARCSDAEFLRRASLDLTGMPASVEEVRAFLADASPDKRAALIDRLLASSHFARQMATVFDVMLMERRPNSHVSQDEWHAYLFESFRTNKPWNVLAREILAADGDTNSPRAAVRFALDRGAEPNLLTRDIGRIFFGRDMQCAQCHDHPLIDDYHQADYHGLLALVAPGFLFTKKEGDKQINLFAEKAGGDMAFESVFVKGTRHLTGPRLPGGTELVEPAFLPGDEYQVVQAVNIKPVPKFSRRAKLAELATDGSNRAFNENIANRLWAIAMGRGLVHPPDLHHSGNPAADPQLLRLLGERIAAMNFDMRAFLRELLLTEVYQRPIDVPADLGPAAVQAAAQLPQLQLQQTAMTEANKAPMQAYETAAAAWAAAEAALLPAVAESDAARTQYAEAKKKLDEAMKPVAEAKALWQAKQDVAGPVAEAAAKAAEAAKKLPNDAEIAAAAAKFAERATQLAAEVAAAQKVIDEKTAAAQPLVDAQNQAKLAVEAAAAKMQPLRDAMRQQETALVAARQQMMADAANLARLGKRLKTTESIAAVKSQADAVAAATAAIAARDAELAAAKQQAAEYVATLAQLETALKTATDAHAAATAKMTAAQAELTRRTELVQTVAAAVASADAAVAKLPGDAVLVEATGKLKQRTEQLQAEAAAAQTAVTTETTAVATAAEAIKTTTAARDQGLAEKTRRDQVAAATEAAAAAARTDLAGKQAAAQQFAAAIGPTLADEFSLASLKALSPEQLCWSVLKVTGVYERYWQAEVAELDKASPLTEEQKQDAAVMAARRWQLEQRVYDKLKGNVPAFVQFYAAAAGQPQGDFFATADQALFAANGGTVISWASPAGGNVSERAAAQADPRLAAEDFYLTIFGRLPTEPEIADVTAYFAARPNEKPAAAAELTWALLNSAEFRFSH